MLDLVPEARFLTTMAFHPEEFNSPPRGTFLPTLGKPTNSLGWVAEQEQHWRRLLLPLHQAPKGDQKLDIKTREVSTYLRMLSFCKKIFFRRKKNAISIVEKSLPS